MARRSSTVGGSDTGTLLEAMGDRLIIGTVGAPRSKPTTAPEAKPAPFTAAALLATMAAAAPTKGGKSATLAVSLPELDSTIIRWADAKAARDHHEALMKDAEDQIIAEGAQARLDACRRAGKVESTIRINNRVSMTQKCQYSPIPMDAAPRLDEAFATLAAGSHRPLHADGLRGAVRAFQDRSRRRGDRAEAHRVEVHRQHPQQHGQPRMGQGEVARGCRRPGSGSITTGRWTAHDQSAAEG